LSKFKDGDWVRCISRRGSSGYLFGEDYQVKDTYQSSDGERIYTVSDSNGSTSNGWHVKHFKLTPKSKAQVKAQAKTKDDPATVLGTQVGGSHYTDCAIQPIEYIWANKLGFSEGNIVKYITRWRTKGGIKDLKKMVHHGNLLIERAEADEAKGVKFGL
jgi:Protein of unknwon function (DUF3310)